MTRWSARSWCRASENSTFSVHDQRLDLRCTRTSEPAGAPARPAELRSAHAELEKRVEERTRELAEVNEKLLGQIGERLRRAAPDHQAMHDALTGLPNRLHLLDRSQDALARQARVAGVRRAALDLDRFAGQRQHRPRCAIACWWRWRASYRWPAPMTWWRLGGEFAVLLQCPQGLAQALEFGQRLLLALQESMWDRRARTVPVRQPGHRLVEPALPDR